MTQGERSRDVAGLPWPPTREGQHRPCQKVQISMQDGLARRKHPLAMGIEAGGRDDAGDAAEAKGNGRTE